MSDYVREVNEWDFDQAVSKSKTRRHGMRQTPAKKSMNMISNGVPFGRLGKSDEVAKASQPPVEMLAP